MISPTLTFKPKIYLHNTWFLRTLFLYRRKHTASFLQRKIAKYFWGR